MSLPSFSWWWASSSIISFPAPLSHWWSISIKMLATMLMGRTPIIATMVKGRAPVMWRASFVWQASHPWAMHPRMSPNIYNTLFCNTVCNRYIRYLSLKPLCSCGTSRLSISSGLFTTSFSSWLLIGSILPSGLIGEAVGCIKASLGGGPRCIMCIGWPWICWGENVPMILGPIMPGILWGCIACLNGIGTPMRIGIIPILCCIICGWPNPWSIRI